MMIVQSLKDLERRLAEAKGPDREIDCFLWAIGREQLAWQGDLLVSPSEGVIGYIDPGKHSRNFSTSRATAGPGSLPASTASLDAAIALVERVLPGWFWTTGKCKLNAHATVGPDRDGPHAHLLKDPTFDNGFDADMEHGIPALALCLACVRALIAQGEK